MPVRAFLDSDLDRKISGMLLCGGVSMPVRAFLDSDVSYKRQAHPFSPVSMPVRAFLDSDQLRAIRRWIGAIPVSMPVRAFLDSDKPALPVMLLAGRGFNARQGIS